MTKFALIRHGRTTDRVGTYDTIEAAKVAAEPYNPHPIVEHDGEWVAHPKIYRTDDVIRHKSIWGAGTDNPNVGLAIWELEVE